MRIRFLLVTVDHLAGTERAAVVQANALAAAGHDVEIVSVLRTSPTPRDDVARAVRVRYLTSAGGDAGVNDVQWRVDEATALAASPSVLVPARWDPTLNALCDVVLERYLPAADADVVVTMTPGLLAAAAQRLPASTALVHQEHRSSMHRTAGVEPLLAFAPRADAVVSLTEVNADWLRRQLGPLAPPIHVVPNAAPGQEQPQSGLDRPLIVAAGRLDAGKQYVHLVRAFGSIADQIPEWRLRIFGSGKKRASLMRTARRYGLYDRLELPGETTDLAAEWAKASISALTSSLEALPLVIQESLAAGVPVVAYDCPTGPGEMIRHGVNGFLVPQDDEEALAGHLLELAQDLELRKRLGAAARESLGGFDAAAVTAQWLAIYSDVLDGRRDGRVPWLARGASRRAEEAEPTAPPVPAITPAEARHTLVAAMARSLASLPGWFALAGRGDFAPTFVVPGERRDEALDALRHAGFPAFASLVVEERDHWLPRRGEVATTARALRGVPVGGLAVEPWPRTTDGASHLSSGAQVRVEFWSRDRDGCLNARQPNPYARRVADDDIVEDLTVDGVPVPGLRGMSGPFVETRQFPVDVVYTWVDDCDPVWQEARDLRRQVSASSQARREASGDARFRNRDELRYSLRSIHAHAPWVRTIHVVTAGQRPGWLLDHPKVRLVDHRDILPEEALPTFNSHAIETALHRVPDLAEQFVYFNDDVFLARPLGPEQFFAPTGQFAAFLAEVPVGLEGRDSRPFIQAGLNNRQQLLERFGVTSTQTLPHSPHPMRRRVLEELGRDFAEAIDRTARSPFRAPTDLAVASSLVQHYGLATGDAYLGAIDVEFVNTSRANVRSRLRALLSRECDAFCIGDHHDYALPEEEVSATLASFLEQYFPVRPPWEGE